MFRRRSKKRKRLRFILSKLVIYGFDEVSIRLGLPGVGVARRLYFRRRRAGVAEESVAVRLRLLLEELGPTFVKLGQLLSLRSDLLSDEITTELRKLQTEVLPFDGADAQRIVAQQLGSPVSQLFSKFEYVPIASASISQVHAAITKSGRKVAVKIQRPDAIGLVATDLALLKDIARLAVRHIPASRIYKPEEVIEQFDRTLSTELDFFHEGRTMDLFRDLFRSNHGIHIPEVLWEMTTQQVLTMEHLEGIGLDRLPTLKGAPFDRKVIARRGAQYMLDQVFEHGIFNADPHPGNFIVMQDNVLAAVDFGMIGTVDAQVKGALLDAMEAFFRREPEKLVRVFERLNLLPDDADLAALRHELANIVNYYYNIPAAHLRAEQILGDITAIIRRYQISIPVDLTLVFKVIVTLEALAKELDPDFNVIQAFRPFLIRHFVHRLDPREHAKNIGAFTEDLIEVAKTLPYDFGLIIRKVRSGKLRVQMEHQNLDDLAGQVSKSLNRLSFSIIIAGILIGSSLMTQVQSIPRLFGIPILALAGYVISGILGLWLLLSIIRSRSV